MRRLILVVAVVLLSACGGKGSPAAPSPPPPPPPPPAPMPTARIVSAGGGSFSFCNPAGCIFQGPMRNEGAGCANAVRGAVTFFAAQQQALGTFQWSIGAAVVIRPAETFVFTAAPLPASVNVTTQYSVNPSWTDVACP